MGAAGICPNIGRFFCFFGRGIFMWTVDGSFGEGGGQILRTSLSLALLTGKELHIQKIRAGRERSGLLRQHLAAVRAAVAVSEGVARGAELGSKELYFKAGAVKAGEYSFRIGSAGSATLVLQTLLPALLSAGAPSRVFFEGGTHNPLAPSFEFLERAFLPLLNRMGASVKLDLHAQGFYPAGGGSFTAHIEPNSGEHRALELQTRGALLDKNVRATVVNLPPSIAMRELKAAGEILGWEKEHLRPEVRRDEIGPGNVLTIELGYEHIREVFTGFGMKGVSAESVGVRTAKEAKAYMEGDAPVGEHLADQLILPMVLYGGGRFRTVEPSMHTKTHVELLRTLMGARIRVEEEGMGVWQVEVG